MRTLNRISALVLVLAFTGCRSQIRIVDTLHSPMAVTGWSPDGLHLVDDRVIQLPEFRTLPSTSLALSEVQKRGVEIDAQGRVFGLVRVVHWCGNDPVREHIAKVNVSDMLTFLRQGDRSPVPKEQQNVLAQEPGGRFFELGWDASEFKVFQIVFGE